MHTALTRCVGTTAMIGGLAIGLIACGDESSSGTAGSASPSQQQPNTVAPTTTSPLEISEARVENSNAPAVPGPSLPPATSVPESKKLPDLGGTRCDTVNGPDGALHVVIFPDSSIECAAAMPVAEEYAPMIASGKPQQVQGWDCGPSQTRGVLSRCVKGGDTFGFSVE